MGVLATYKTINKWQKTGLWAGLFFIAYTIFGFFILPVILQKVSTDKLTQALARQVSINKIQFNRYTLFVLHCEQLIIYYLFTGNEVASIEKVTRFMHELINTRVWYELNRKPYQVTTRQQAELRILVRHYFLDSPYK